MIISHTGEKTWTNRHETFTQNIDNLYNLGNNNTGSVLNDYNDATTGVQGIIAEAISSHKELRVLGGEWSWTKIAATAGILLNTKPLNLSFRLSANNLSPAYVKTQDDLYFAQCGVSCKELNDRLANRNRSLKTTGASNGQTIAGALSTGTHGSAIDVGAIADYIVGLHIIVGPTKHIWLERASYPVVSDSFIVALKTELVRDDELFNAALVSFGSFGFIHGVMLETVPLFLYEAYRVRIPIDDVLYNLMETLDFTNSPLPNQSKRPYHFQVLINQYDKSNLAYATVMYQRPFDPAHTPPVIVPGIGPGDDAPSFIGLITQQIPALVPALVNKMIAGAYKPYPKMMGTHGEMFFNTDLHGKVMSLAAAIPVSAVKQVTDLLMQLNNSHGPFVGVFAYRFVKGSTATLGFTQFKPTCIIELDGVHSRETDVFYRAFQDELNAQNIPHSFHWGKIFDADEAQIRKMYSDKKVDDWLKARNAVLENSETKTVFTNDIMRQWGLD